MTAIKNYTSLEQSQKLAEILPLESADMEYLAIKENSKLVGGVPFVKDDSEVEDSAYSHIYDRIACWSLAALLQVLPLGIYDELDDRDYELEINMIDKMPRYVRLGDVYHSQFPYDFEKDTLLDNVVESIIWLNNNNYFKL